MKLGPARIGLLACFATILSIIACSGQADRSLDDAMAVAEQGNQALQDLDWEAYAALLHPDELDRFKGSVMPDLERLAPQDSAGMITLFDRKFNIDSLRASTSGKFFVDILQTVFRISPELKRSFTKMQNENIGAVPQADTLAHVVVHTTMQLGMQFVDEMNVTSMRKYEGAWKLRLSAKIEGIAYMLQQSLQAQKP
ncbi:MAG: hypothetical protein JSW34_13160 [Candidatus Zixiibacteriota bacterium]|nr:MAG: hypothetical protein JSW34_13160 [candidate division Zixibacteria bacterium]